MFEKLKDVKKTVWAVLLLIVIMFVGLVKEANADVEPMIGLGKGIIHSDSQTQFIGAFLKDKKWEINAIHFGEDKDTKKGPMPDHWAFTASRYVYFDSPFKKTPWLKFYAKMGYTHISKRNPLVGCRNMFNLGVGVRIADVLYIGEEHISSAGICSPNTGVDVFALKFVFPL